ncbi:MAG: sulfotransferase [Rhodobacteraceae bacterium]|nr:sulfotransferase [Paracoccaceae bacterium]
MIFVVGNSRSGTTMLGRMFNKNPAVHTFGELHYFEQMVDYETTLSRPDWTNAALTKMLERLLTSAREVLFAPVVPGRYREAADEILAACLERDPVSVYKSFLLAETAQAGAEVPCEQTPRYLYQAEEILAAFPEARLVCLVRDPHAVLLSQKNKWRRRKLGASNMPMLWSLRAWVNYHPYTMSRMWVSTSKIAHRIAEHERVVVLRFEELASDPEQSVRRLSDFCGIEFNTEMLEVEQVGSSSRQDRPGQFGIDASRVTSWKDGALGDGEIALCESVAREQMQRWGYELTGKQQSRMQYVLFMIGFAAKSMLALALNINRVKNIREVIRRLS